MTRPLNHRRIAPRARAASFWVAAAVALLVAHDLVVLIQVGPGAPLADALRTAGHGYWPAASTALVVVGALVAIGWSIRLAVLRHRARRASSAGSSAGPAGWRRRFVHLWPRLFALVSLAFLVQENVEHLVAHEHLLGGAALVGPEYPLALPAIAAVSALAAALAGGIRQSEAALILRLAIAGRATRPALRLTPRRPDRGRSIRRDPLARLRSGRAPPTALLPAATA